MVARSEASALSARRLVSRSLRFSDCFPPCSPPYHRPHIIDLFLPSFASLCFCSPDVIKDGHHPEHLDRSHRPARHRPLAHFYRREGRVAAARERRAVGPFEARVLVRWILRAFARWK